jgi:hypothetical protein
VDRRKFRRPGAGACLGSVAPDSMSLFEEEMPSTTQIRRRSSRPVPGRRRRPPALRGRYGARRTDEPQTPLPIHIIVDGNRAHS